MQDFLDRVRELIESGMDEDRAAFTARIDRLISKWPSAWGNSVQFFMFGDFEPPDHDLDFPELRIRILATPAEGTGITIASCVLRATGEVDARTPEALLDLSRRVNSLLGLITFTNLGNPYVGWWSFLSHLDGGGVGSSIEDTEIAPLISRLQDLRPSVRKYVESALYWIREARTPMHIRTNRDHMRLFAGWWNAFENLVYGLATVYPVSRMDRVAKETAFDEILAAHGGVPSIAAVEQMSRILNPGFVEKAKHILTVCFGAEAPYYVENCFTTSVREDRLYTIRNAIKHGTIDAENPEELDRIQLRARVLWHIVWRLLGAILATRTPLDPAARRSASNVDLEC